MRCQPSHIILLEMECEFGDEFAEVWQDLIIFTYIVKYDHEVVSEKVADLFLTDTHSSEVFK